MVSAKLWSHGFPGGTRLNPLAPAWASLHRRLGQSPSLLRHGGGLARRRGICGPGWMIFSVSDALDLPAAIPGTGVSDSLRVYDGVGDLLRERLPTAPVYCIHPRRYQDVAAGFRRGFPGTVLYAVKSNDEPPVLRALYAGGIRHFDCASLPEVELVNSCCPGATCYFMIPVRLRGAASDAFHRYGVRHFLVDQLSGLEDLAGEVPLAECVVFARMAVHHGSAAFDLSSKFGAHAAEVPNLLRAIRQGGAEPGLAFNVGSLVSDPGAYVQGLKAARSVLEQLDFDVAWLDIGGGFPADRGAITAPPLSQYFDRIRQVLSELPLAPGAQVLGEPGRALAAPGVSLLLEVLARKGSSLYLNDGVYGALWELRFYEDASWMKVDIWREGARLTVEGFDLEAFTVFGPTCDSVDVLPSKLHLPANLRRGDYLQIHGMGAYSLAGRTRFNGHYSDDFVQIND